MSASKSAEDVDPTATASPALSQSIEQSFERGDSEAVKTDNDEVGAPAKPQKLTSKDHDEIKIVVDTLSDLKDAECVFCYIFHFSC